ncbi:ABC transporter ATP-binding protein [Natrinema sp. 1APR25-10V2]|uniref:ABC transporter ATP-binding protein n=1 Tax=Natrinema sp. 1APR25-10V2 TaxID=2951081 RepID=UPI00287467EA|nr:ABC transporter ATP-binding protein [Natrinema sp. 1APR25-10V2]MDS0476296.1 ABC transporter ATP-binding protein [Natrinema sp. 1APR25-10V2]
MTAIQTDNLTKRYGDVAAVDGLDLSVEDGEVFGFLGPNGAGKSTTIDMLLDYVRPTEGTASVLGMDVHEESAALRDRIGVLPEGIALYDRLTGRRHLEFAIDWADADDDPAAVLDRVGLDEHDGTRSVGDYSKGMQQRLALGMALVGEPDLLILDEPSSGLDPHGIRRMRELVREEARNGTTVFFSSHVLGQVEAVCDRVGILSGGRLVAVDTVDGLRKTVGAGSELRLRVSGDVDPDLAGLAAVEGVDSVWSADGVLRVACSDPRAKARVVTRLTNAGIDVLDVDSEEASLEDVFAAYTTDAEGLEAEADEPATVEEVVP